MEKAAQVHPVVAHVFVEGRVQGVGYRYFLRGWALRLAISGWVRNRTDGSVEALARGAADKVEMLLAEMRQGPPGSRVIRLRIDDEDDGADADHFVIRPTL